MTNDAIGRKKINNFICIKITGGTGESQSSSINFRLPSKEEEEFITLTRLIDVVGIPDTFALWGLSVPVVIHPIPAARVRVKGRCACETNGPIDCYNPGSFVNGLWKLGRQYPPLLLNGIDC